MKPMFISGPSHIDDRIFYRAAENVESKLYSAMPEIEKKLSTLDTSYVSKSEPPDYYVHWFRRNYDNYLAYLQVYAYIISISIPEHITDISKVRLLDFGGGWGLMGMVAREAGIGYVEYIDVPGVTSAAKVISRGSGLGFDNYSEKGGESLKGEQPNRFDSIVSSDVLEHVYNIDIIFENLSHACAPEGVVLHQTGANPRSPWQRRKLMNLHKENETTEPDALYELHQSGGKAIWEYREEFLQTHFPVITGHELDKLVTATRGLNEHDLKKAADKFMETGKYPIPEHETNTCLLNGYWIERLMDPSKVKTQLETQGFKTTLERTYWGLGRSSLPKKVTKTILNAISRISINAGLALSFYYSVKGIKKS